VEKFVDPATLTLDEKLEILRQAADMGAKTLQICHEGEPFIDSTTLPMIREASKLGMETFIYTTAADITPDIASELYSIGVCLGVHCDSLRPDIFNKMLGGRGAEAVYGGIRNLLNVGYNKPFRKNEKLYTRLGLVCTLTSLNTADIEVVKEVAQFSWRNGLFFCAARLEKGGRAVSDMWDRFRIKDSQKIIDFIEWCSQQTGINYWHAQPAPYCVGVCGLHIGHSGDVWVTAYGGSCDFTEPDGESFPEKLPIIGNVRKEGLPAIVAKLWEIRRGLVSDGTLDKKLADYMATKDIYPNGLQDCGSARTHTLFQPFHEYVTRMVGKMANP
jgi:hypothetical protein